MCDVVNCRGFYCPFAHGPHELRVGIEAGFCGPRAGLTTLPETNSSHLKMDGLNKNWKWMVGWECILHLEFGNEFFLSDRTPS